MSDKKQSLFWESHRVWQRIIRETPTVLIFALLLFAILFTIVDPTDTWTYRVVVFTAASMAVLLCLFGMKYLFRDLIAEKHVIPDEDRVLLESLLKEGNDKAIDQYVRLSSLTGSTGTATKLGLTGLPLATIGLTLFFSATALFQSEFLDLAKLTLGAFIGSFVQKAVGSQSSPAGPPSSHQGAYRKPSSEVVAGGGPGVGNTSAETPPAAAAPRRTVTAAPRPHQ